MHEIDGISIGDVKDDNVCLELPSLESGSAVERILKECGLQQGSGSHKSE